MAGGVGSVQLSYVTLPHLECGKLVANPKDLVVWL